MHEWGILVPVAAIIAGPMGFIANTWIRARHGYPLEGKKGQLINRGGALDDGRRIELLTAENDKLAGQVSRLEERLRVLERIATDPAARTAREIDALR